MAFDFDAFQDAGLVALDKRGRGAVLPPSLVQDGVHYRKYLGPGGEILFVPVVEVPLPEAWLYQNPEALASVERGLADFKAGQVGPEQDFSAFLGAEGA